MVGLLTGRFRKGNHGVRIPCGWQNKIIMKIIKRGVSPKIAEIEKECKKCKTMFAYIESDIHPDARDGNYVICPVCETFINVE